MSDGRISFTAGIDTAQLQADARRSRELIQGIGDAARDEGAKIDAAFKKIGAAIAGVFTVQKATEFVSQVINVRKEIQSLELSFEALLGSKEKADAMLNGLKKFAAETPMSLNTLAKGAQTLLGFNIEADKVETYLRAIGDISMGDAQRFDSLVLAFSQMSSTGKLMSQDLNQMINAGFNPLNTISEKTGKSISDLRDEMSKGAISAEEIQQAFVDATTEGGKFYNMLAIQSEGISGSIAKLQGTITDMFNSIGENSEGIITGSISVLQKLADNYETVGRVIAELVATYGVYKAALLTLTAAENLRYQAALAHMAGLTKMQAIMDVLRAKTAALNATMMKNPYVLVAAGVAALSLAIYKLATYQTEAEKAQARLNAATKDMNASIAAERAKIDILFARLKAAKEGTEEYKSAKAAILSQYGSYLKGLGDEAQSLNDVALAYRTITAEATKAAKARAMASFTEQAAGDYAKVESDAREDIYKKLSKKFKGQTDSDGVALAEVYFQKLIPVIEGREKMSAELQEVVKKFDSFSMSGGSSTIGQAASSHAYNSLKLLLGKVERARATMENTMAEAQRRFGTEEKKAEEEAHVKQEETKPAATIDPKAAAELAKAAAERVKAIEAYKQDVADAITAAEAEIKQADINAMEDGYKKSVAQINLNYDRLIAANVKRREEMIEALKENKMNEWLNANPTATAEQTEQHRSNLNVGTDDLSSDQQKTLAEYERVAAEARNKALADLNKQRLENERASIQEYIKAYGEYEQKRVALTQEAEDKIKKIQADKSLTDTDKEFQTKSIEAGLKKSLEELDFNNLKKNMDWDTIFGNIDNMPVEVLNMAAEQLRAFKAAATDLSPDQIKTITEALEELKSKADLTAPVATIKAAAAAYKQAKKEFQAASKAYNEAEKNGDKTGMANAAKQMTASSKKMADAASSQQAAYEVLGNAASEYAAFLKELGDTIGGTAGEMLKLASSAITAGQGMAAGAQAFAAAASTIEKASAVLAIVQAAFQLISGIVSLFGGKEDKGMANYVDAMDSYISILTDCISDLNDAMMDTKNSISETLGIYKQLVGLEEKQAEAIKKQSQVRLNSGASGNSRSEGYKQAKKIYEGWKSSDEETYEYYKEQVYKLDAYKQKAGKGSVFSESPSGSRYLTIGGFDRLDYIWNLDDDDLRAIAKDPELLAALGDLGDEVVNYVAALDAGEELKKQLNEAILGVSFDDFYSDFVDMISDMDSDTEDFANNFSEYMRNALIKDMVSKSAKERLQKLYDNMAATMKDETLSEEEKKEAIKRYKEEYLDIVEDTRQDLKNIDEITGYSAEEASREASQKGIATASQESVDENNARLTTIQGHTYILAQSAEENKANIAAMTEHMKDIRSLANAGLQHLADISRNTYQLYETNQRLKRVEEDLSGINTKGVIIRSV